MKISYTKQSGYLLPNLTLPKEENTYGHFGRMRKVYLKEHRRSLYNALLLSGKLESHLVEIDRHANEMLELLIGQMALVQGITEALKTQDQLAWVGATNQIHYSAKEVVGEEVVYA